MHKFLLRVLLLFPVVLVSPCLIWRSAIAKEVDPVSQASRPSPSASEVKLASADKLPAQNISSAPSIVPSPDPSVSLAAPTPSVTETPPVDICIAVGRRQANRLGFSGTTVFGGKIRLHRWVS